VKIVLEYEEATGQITDKDGQIVGNWFNPRSFEQEEDKGAKVRDIIKLKDAGFSAEDIVTMKDGGVL